MSNTTFEKLIKYFIFDLEYRKDGEGKWILCQLAYRCLNRRFEYIFEHSVYFVDSSRVNVAGISQANIDDLAKAMVAVINS